MLVPETTVHLILWSILVIEIVFLLFQLFYVIGRPSDKSRYWFPLLIACMLYNTVACLFLPDANLSVSMYTQHAIVYFGKLLISFIFPFFIYKTMRIQKLRFYAYWGAPLFLCMSFIISHLFPCYLIGTIDLNEQFLQLIPYIYALSFMYILSYGMYHSYKELRKRFSNGMLAIIYVSITIFTMLLIGEYIHPNQAIGTAYLHSGFLVFATVAVGKNIRNYKKEYKEYIHFFQTAPISVVENIPESNQAATAVAAYSLTKREKEIAGYLADNHTYKEIADILFISEKTVAKHISNMYAKTDVSQKAGLLKKLNSTV